MYDGLNVGKLNVALNLKKPESVALVKRLVTEWCDAVAENYAPKAMKGFGLDYDTLAAIKPDLVMISVCLNGQTGPHKDYPGFGGQGAALGGYNALTGWPDREPVGPYGTITDSLAPRYVAAALAAGLLYRRRTGKGVYLDISQVESANWSLSPWLLDYEVDGVHPPPRRRPAPRTCARTARSRASTKATSATGGSRSRAGPTTSGRRSPRSSASTTIRRSRRSRRARSAKTRSKRVVSAWTATRTRAEVAEQLQALGVEAVPVEDFGDLHDDPQLALRNHFEPHTHAFLGAGPLRAQRLPLVGRAERVRPGRTDARPGHRLGAARPARLHRRRDRRR